MRPDIKTVRNADIRELVASGDTMTKVAKRHGISRQRVDQIVHPEKHRARSVIRNALKAGSLTRAERCERCGDAYGTIQAHHPNYSKVWEVEWLCVLCHGAEHADSHLREKVVRICPVCGDEHRRIPSDLVVTCSPRCGLQYSIQKSREEKWVDREPRFQEMATRLSDFVDDNQYVPGTVEFAMYATGKSVGSAISILSQRLDPHIYECGSYAAVMDRLYLTAGYPRPSYGRDDLPTLGEK